MALPEKYELVEKYFEDVIKFLKCHQWIYNFPNTHITINKCLDKIMDEWVEYSRSLSTHQFSNLTSGLVSDGCPISLKCLLQRILELKPTYTVDKDINELHGKCNISPKKMHEVVKFAAFVKRVSTERNVQYFVDIGAGLGYLPQYLFAQYNYKVLGIESVQKNVQAANNLQNKFHPESKNHVKYKQFTVTENSASRILNDLKESFPEFIAESESFGIIGLHACADLSVNMLHIFENIPQACYLILMPCCYHRIDMKEKQETSTQIDERFLNFPLSNILKQFFIQFDAATFLRRPFLRLAAQQADISWSELSDREIKMKTENCLFRSILQEVCETEHLQISRKKRKTGYMSAFAIQDVIANIEGNFSIRHVDSVNSPACIEMIKGRVLTMWLACYERDLPAMEMFSVLQNVLQGLCENLVLLDMVQYMRERGFASCQAIKITDQHISPRCYAIVAFK